MIENRRMYIDEDTRLMIKASEGDKNAYEELYNKYFSAVTSFVSSIDSQLQASEDISQEVFTRVWENREKYQPIATFKTYIFKYAKNVLSERLKSNSKEAIVRNLQFSEDSDCSSAHTLKPECKIAEGNIVEAVHKALSLLTVKQLRSVELFHYMGISLNKAAKVAGCSEKAFEKRLSRAHQCLHKALAAFEQGGTRL